MSTIIKIVFTTLLTFYFSLSTLFAQNDTMYVLKSGVVVGQYNVNTEVDSVIFYKPTISDPTSGTFTDARDGKDYNWVNIGNQVWMAENLKYLPSVVGPATASQTPYYYVYGYNGTNVADAKATANYSTYGVLYNWHAAMNGAASSAANPSGVQGICPTGWHLPSDAEWTELTDYLGGASVAGGKLKETGTTHWNSPNTGATNETGFTALPGGHRGYDGTFGGVSSNGLWWSATEYFPTHALYRNVSYYGSDNYIYHGNKKVGFSVRCVRDSETSSLSTVTTTAASGITGTTATSGGNISSHGGATVTARGVCWSTSQNPTTANSKTTNGTGTGSFTSDLTELIPNTTYYVRAYATNMVGTEYGNQESFTTLPQATTVSDVDGNIYNAVTIGTQVWMAEKLKTTRYSDGAAIPLVNNGTSWNALTRTDKAYCWYNDDIANKAVYGALYTWAAAMNGAASVTANPSGIQGVCPTGWHLPSDAEWTELTDYLGGASVAGGKLKETGTTHWNSPNTGATNETGFTALPGGCRDFRAAFGSVSYYGFWWSATESSTGSAWRRYMYYNLSSVGRDYSYEEVGFSVRCVRD